MGMGGIDLRGVVLKNLALSAVGCALLEQAALAGAGALKESQGTALKVAKFSLSAIALVGAFAATLAAATGLGFGAAIFAEWCSEVAPSFLIGFAVWSIVAISTIPIHLKAFKMDIKQNPCTSGKN